MIVLQGPTVTYQNRLIDITRELFMKNIITIFVVSLSILLTSKAYSQQPTSLSAHGCYSAEDPRTGFRYAMIYRKLNNGNYYLVAGSSNECDKPNPFARGKEVSESELKELITNSLYIKYRH